MRTFTYMILALSLSITGCTSQKKLVAEPPVTMGTATCQAWAGGRAETGSGMLLEIPIEETTVSESLFDKAYFRGKIAEVTVESTENGWVAKANFMNSNGMGKSDMVMDADPKNEVGNKPPQLAEKFPFELENDQCVLSFMQDGTTKYFKVTGIKEKKPLFYK